MIILSLLAAALWSAQAGQETAATAVPLALTVDEAVNLALERSFQLQRSQRNERIARERVNNAKASAGPRLDISIGADQFQRYSDFHGRYDYTAATPEFSTNVAANASYDFDIAAVRSRSLKQARLSQESGLIDVAQSSSNIAVDTRLTYLQAFRAQQQVSVDQEYLARVDKLIERAGAGRGTILDFLATERSNSALILDQSRQSAELALSSLRQQLRLGDEQPLKLISALSEPQSIPPLARLIEIAYANRSDIRQSQIHLQQARIAQAQAKDFRRPSLRASAFAAQTLTGDTFVGTAGDVGRARSAGVAISFNLPIWSYDGGALDASRRIAAIQAEQAIADAEEAKERARNEITSELIGLRRARARIDQTPDPAQARQALERAEEQMLAVSPAEAAALMAQVSNARQNWRASITLKFDALTAFYVEYFRLQRTLGTDSVR